jgi:hypothetical protein
VQFIDQEPHNALFVLGNHADAVALTQTTNEVFFRPRELEALILDLKYLGHVSSNHPTNMYANLLLAIGTHAGPSSMSASKVKLVNRIGTVAVRRNSVCLCREHGVIRLFTPTTK